MRTMIPATTWLKHQQQWLIWRREMHLPGFYSFTKFPVRYREIPQFRLSFKFQQNIFSAHTPIYRGYYVAVRRYGFYLRVLIISLTGERRERVRDVFNTRRLNPYLQAAM